MVIKFILLALLVFLFVVCQISCSFLPTAVSCVFILMMVLLFYEIFKGKNFSNFQPKHAFFAAIIGGFLLDAYSIFPPGLFLLSLLATLYICCHFVLLRFDLSGFLGVFISAAISVLIYQILILFLSYLYYFIGLSDVRIVFDKFYFTNLIGFLFFNSLLIVLVFQGIINPIFLRHKKR